MVTFNTHLQQIRQDDWCLMPHLIIFQFCQSLFDLGTSTMISIIKPRNITTIYVSPAMSKSSKLSNYLKRTKMPYYNRFQLCSLSRPRLYCYCFYQLSLLYMNFGIRKIYKYRVVMVYVKNDNVYTMTMLLLYQNTCRPYL